MLKLAHLHKRHGIGYLAHILNLEIGSDNKLLSLLIPPPISHFLLDGFWFWSNTRLNYFPRRGAGLPDLGCPKEFGGALALVSVSRHLHRNFIFCSRSLTLESILSHAARVSYPSTASLPRYDY